ncbi:MAG: flagellar hook protein FlgE [Rhodocyclaceae bacterium]|nr:flagellar hook protein FlgE [Rhodocyclaceae bacterium]MBX3678377.1 flagellar hook protein FlgE [Rhodocyclaceae bacterium]MCB1893092.1 flagellar hook protein FlgE [Rhodocyclaceae bacterium]MCP5297444.1 flagellar hook protein FlgE [Zoogloeaceae bacterium]MCW5596423.1 flagellar hook protein FlgE [Rhodocyclaceae bacterium]
MSFQQGLSGLNGAAKALDAIGNNVSNASTSGFKSSSAQFADVFASSLTGGGGTQVGIGTTINAVKQSFTQGNISVTNNPLDVAINGGGFFRMSDNGAISYTRNGQFLIDKDGYVVNSAAQRLTGYAATATGVIVPSTPSEIRVDTSDLTPQATSLSEVGLNLDSRQGVPATAFAVTDPTSYNASTSMSVYDTLGNSHVMGIYFVKTATANQWSLYTNLDGGAPTAATTVTFTAAGQLSGFTPVAQSFAVTTGATSPMTYNLDLTGSTQFGSSFGVNRIAQDGYTSGRLSGVAISPDGIMQGRYSNGQSRNLSQIVLVNFNNPNGLQPLGGNQWAESSASGQPIIGAPASGTLGVLQSAAIEESNVDLTAELVSMITAQRNYQANAQTIKTQDQVLQTLVNLR